MAPFMVLISIVITSTQGPRTGAGKGKSLFVLTVSRRLSGKKSNVYVAFMVRDA